MSTRSPRSQDRINELTAKYREKHQRINEPANQPKLPKNTVPWRLRFLFWCIHRLGAAQSRLSRMTGQTLYCSQDGRTTLVSQMDDKHLANAVRKMKRENNTDWMYDCLVQEQQRRRGERIPPTPLEVAAREVAERDKPLWKKILNVAA